MKLLLPALLISIGSIAQTADFIQLKKKGKTVQSFYAGTNIQFSTNYGAYFDGRINSIQHDTLYLQQFITQYLPTTFGTYIIDTVGSYHFKYHFNQIAWIGKAEKKNFNWRGSGASLMGGGALLTLGSGIVWLTDKEKFSLPLLGAAIGLGTLGYFMAKGGSKGIAIGKKYTLNYMRMGE